MHNEKSYYLAPPPSFSFYPFEKHTNRSTPNAAQIIRCFSLLPKLNDMHYAGRTETLSGLRLQQAQLLLLCDSVFYFLCCDQLLQQKRHDLAQRTCRVISTVQVNQGLLLRHPPFALITVYLVNTLHRSSNLALPRVPVPAFPTSIRRTSILHIFTGWKHSPRARRLRRGKSHISSMPDQR